MKYMRLFIIMILVLPGSSLPSLGQYSSQPTNCGSSDQSDPNSAAEVSSPDSSKNTLPVELDRLLDQVEQAGAKLKSIQADMVFKQEQILLDTVTLRNGKLYYQTDGKTVKARIYFSDFLQKDLEEPKLARRIVFNEDFAFDGQWVRRRNERTNSRQLWEVSKSPHNKEAFRLGKGPFPLPFSIQKKDVVEHFEIASVKADPCDPPQCRHLKLIPRKKSPYAEEYLRMDLWISQRTALPEQISYEKDDFEITMVTWTKPVIDKKIKDSIFALPAVGRDWPPPEIHRLEESTPKTDAP